MPMSRGIIRHFPSPILRILRLFADGKCLAIELFILTFGYQVRGMRGGSGPSHSSERGGAARVQLCRWPGFLVA